MFRFSPARDAGEGQLAKCIRVMIHWNTEKAQKDVLHIYLRKAGNLRPDLKSS
jgi:chorismate mutase